MNGGSPTETPPSAASDRWREAFYSSLLPGLGALLEGHRAEGTWVLLLGVGLAITAVASLWVDAVPMPASIAFLALACAVGMFGMVRPFLRESRDARPPASAWRAAFWSRLLPGLGQLVDGRWLAGVGILLATVVLGALITGAIGVVVDGVVMLFAMLEALAGSRRPRPARADLSRAVLVVGMVLVAQPLLVLAVRRYVVQAFRVPAASMHPALEPGDFLFVDRTRAGRAAAGEIVAFRAPFPPHDVFLKRCVAEAGDVVEIHAKELFVNGRKVDEPYVRHEDPAFVPGDLAPRDEFGPVTVPPGHVFLMGDHRDDSADSRFWGTVPVRDVLGRALRIYWPPSRWRRPR